MILLLKEIGVFFIKPTKYIYVIADPNDRAV